MDEQDERMDRIEADIRALNDRLDDHIAEVEQPPPQIVVPKVKVGRRKGY